MLKGIGRLAQTKVNMQVNIRLTQIGAQVEEDCQLQLMWKRGPQEDKSEQYEINSIQEDTDVDFLFSRVSSFYMSGKKYERKTCEFHIYRYNAAGKRDTIAYVSDFDMSRFCNKEYIEHRIDFKNSSLPGTFVVLSWSLSDVNNMSKD